jgi:uncharacterized RDD family membrane protein YckC
VNPTSDPAPDSATAQPSAAPAQPQPAPAMRPPTSGEQLSGWNPPPPPGWVLPPGQQPPYGWPPPGGYLPPPPPTAPNGQPLANFGDRFLAFLLDYVIYYAVSMLVSVPVYLWWLFSFFDTIREGADRPYTTAAGPEEFFSEFFLPLLAMGFVILLVNLLLTYLYFVEFQLRRGQTIGKKTLKLKIIQLDPAGGPLTRSDLAKRWAVAWMVGTLVPLFHYLDGLWQLWDKPFQQCLHDKAAKTVVVKVG